MGKRYLHTIVLGSSRLASHCCLDSQTNLGWTYSQKADWKQWVRLHWAHHNILLLALCTLEAIASAAMLRHKVRTEE